MTNLDWVKKTSKQGILECLISKYTENNIEDDFDEEIYALKWLFSQRIKSKYEEENPHMWDHVYSTEGGTKVETDPEYPHIDYVDPNELPFN